MYNLRNLMMGLLVALAPAATLCGQNPKNKQAVLNTMKSATHFMMDKVSNKGGFVWNYLPDLSRQWGEMEAYRSMVWIQSPSTPLVGQVLLDAYHATGDEYYYEQAKKVATVLIWGQEPCGGWSYMFDLAGEGSLRKWYNTIGKSGWRLEEFQHYYGNATYDDSCTSDVAKFLLRIYVEKNDPTFRPALDKVINFVLESQYAIGGWPQRYPLRYDHVFRGMADYSSFLTLNDDVIPDNIDFLVQCYQALGLKDVKAPIMRALNLTLAMQQGEPYAGWADQYTVEDVQPAHARSYEPRSVNTGTTVQMINKMCDYYQLTGETKFLSGIPAAIKFLESQKLPDSEVARFGGRTLREGEIMVPRFVDPDTGKPLYVHRKGSNAKNGHYYVDQDISNTIRHYSSAAQVNIEALRKHYEEVKAMSREEATKDSPLLRSELTPLPTYYVMPRPSRRGGELPQVADILKSIDKEGRWITPLTSYSNPYKESPEEMEPSDETKYAQTMVGDDYDTSPYTPTEQVMGISTQVYVSNMARLIQSLANEK